MWDDGSEVAVIDARMNVVSEGREAGPTQPTTKRCSGAPAKYFTDWMIRVDS